jgi:hypothetical protein
MNNVRLKSILILLLAIVFIHFEGVAQTSSQGFFLDTWKPINITSPAFIASAATKSKATDTVIVDVSSVITKVSPYVFGHNAAAWDKIISATPSLINDIKNVNPHIIRFPGGSLSDSYFWNATSKATMPTDLPPTLNYGGGLSFGANNNSWTLSLDAYYSMLPLLNSTGILTVNYAYARYGTSADPVATAAHLAAEWVRYDKGRTRYWEIGNEDYGPWENGYTIDPALNKDGQPTTISGDLYGRHCMVFIDSMRVAAKEVGNDIKIGVVTFPGTSKNTVENNWNAGLMPHISNIADYLIIHDYYTGQVNSDVPTILNSPSTTGTASNSVLNDLKTYGNVSSLPIALTEWGIQSNGSKQGTSYINGLHGTMVLGEVIKNKFGQASRWDFLNGWNNGDNIALFAAGDYKTPSNAPRAPFYYMYYFQKNFGDNMVTSSVKGNDSIVSYASTFSSGQSGIVLVNKGVLPRTVNIKMNNFSYGQRYYYYVLTGGTDSTFSRDVFINGQGAASGYYGGPLNYSSINPYGSTIVNGTINIDIPKYGAVFLLVENSIAPKITIQQSSTNIPNGNGQYNFTGITPVGNSSSPVSFTIQNIGNSNLNLGTITISGTNASEFSITSPGLLTIPGLNGSTTFSIVFKPISLGSKTAIISIASNDPTINPYTFVIVTPPPAPTVTSPVTYCQNSSASPLTATGTLLKWYTSSTGGTGSSTAPTPSTAAVGTSNYYVSQTVNGCEGSRAIISITISVAAIPIITSSSNMSICTGGSIVLTSSTGASYKWFNGTTQVGTAVRYTATTAGNYTVQVTNASGCSATSAVKTITINPLPTATITSPSNNFCAGGSVVLTSSTGASYKWFNGTTQVGTAVSYTATAAGNYTVQVTNASGCSATSAVKTITINPLPTATITSPSNSFCAGGSVVLTSSASASYKWFNGTTLVGTTATYTANTAGNYTVQVTNASGCSTTSAVKTITISALPNATITSPSNNFCAGGSVVLTSSAGASYKWFNGTTQVGTAATYAATTAGNYTVQVTNASGCSATSAVKTITVNPLPTATITSPSNNFCAGGSVVLTSSAGTAYKWFNGTTQVGTAATYTATTAGNYTVQVTNASGCSATSAVKTIIVNPLPTATITSPSNNFCAGGSVVLTSSTGASYKWFNGTTQVGTAVSYTATAVGNYMVEVTNNAGCNATSAPSVISVTNSIIWYADTDGDGKGDPAVTQNSCTQPTGYVSVAGDGCPTDPNKIAPGICGCNVPESSCTKQPQTITFTPFNPNQNVSDPDFNLSASASSGLPITYTSSNPNVAIIIGNTVHIVGPGSTTITASQGGNSTYAPSSTTQTLNIAGAVSQAILQVLDGSTILQDNGAALNIGSAPINTQTLNKTITLKNIGTNDLIIKSLSAIPGFTVTQQNVTSTIQPNQTISILITGIPTDINAPTIGAIHIASNDPNATFTLNVSVDVSTSTSTLGSLLSSQIELFPNPTTGNVSLRFNGSFEEVSIQLFSIDGKFIERKDIGMVANIEEQLLIQELPNGVYFLEIKTKQGSIVKRLIKQ